jgi:hypothetical protein
MLSALVQSGGYVQRGGGWLPVPTLGAAG